MNISLSFLTAFNAKVRTKLINDDSLTKKASLNALASSLEYTARLLVGFIINPILVVGLGAYGYGIWQVLGRLIGYISPATGRPTQALKWTIASHQATADYDFKRQQVGNAVIVMLLFSPLVALLGGILAWFAPIWLDVPMTDVTVVRLAAALLIVNVIMVSLVSLPRAVLEGENLGYRRMGLSALLIFVGGGLTWLAVSLNTGLIGVAAATLATTLLTGLLFFQVVRSYVPWFGVARSSLASARRFAGLSGWFLLWNLVMKAMTAADVIILGIFGSVELVTSYTLTKYSAETVINMVAMVVFGIAPGLGGIIGTGDLQKAAKIRGEIMSFTWVTVTVMGAVIILFNQSFLNLWVGYGFFAGSLETLLIILMIMQFVLIRNDSNIIDLTLELRHKVLLGLLSIGISLIIAVAFVDYFEAGITGLVLGFMIGRLVLSVSYPWMVGRYLSIPFASQFVSILRPTAITAILFGLAIMLQQVIHVSSWLELVILAGLSVLVVSLVVFFTGLTGIQRHRFWSRMKHVVSIR